MISGWAAGRWRKGWALKPGRVATPWHAGDSVGSGEGRSRWVVCTPARWGPLQVLELSTIPCLLPEEPQSLGSNVSSS